MSFSQLTRFFPAPRFVTLPSVGVDISDRALKYVQFRKHRGALELVTWGELPIPPESIVNGEIQDARAVSQVLAEVQKKAGVDYVRLALPEERAYLFESSLERDLTDKEARTALEFRLEENVPLPARDALFDFDVIDHDSDEHTHRVSVTAYNRTTAEAYDAICRGAGFVPLALEVEPSAIARAVIPAGDEGTKLILDFGRTRTGIGIVHRGILMYTSTTSVGGDDLDNALRAVRPNATDDELVTIKNEQGLLIDERDTTVSNALQTPVEKMCGELKARIDYWHTHVATEPERRVTEIVLCGGLTNIAGLREYISEETGIRTARASVWQNVFTSRAAIPPITERQSYGYATAVGLALGGLLANARMYV